MPASPALGPRAASPVTRTPTESCTHRRRVRLAADLRQVLPRHDAQAGRERLQQDGDQVGRHHHPHLGRGTRKTRETGEGGRKVEVQSSMREVWEGSRYGGRRLGGHGTGQSLPLGPTPGPWQQAVRTESGGWAHQQARVVARFGLSGQRLGITRATENPIAPPLDAQYPRTGCCGPCAFPPPHQLVTEARARLDSCRPVAGVHQRHLTGPWQRAGG